MITGNNAHGKKLPKCPAARQCGGCRYQGVPYGEQLRKKQEKIRRLLGEFCEILPIIGMENPYYYRNKVHHSLTRDRSGNIISGPYEQGSHWILDVKNCQIEDRKAQEIIQTAGELLKTFRLRPYDEDRQTGFLRRVLVRRGFGTGEIMAVLVTGTKTFPHKNEYIQALLREHPEITTILQNVNGEKTSMILGEKESVLYGPGYIQDTLLGHTFRISAKSFYQVNPVQTEVLYRTAIEFAELHGTETAVDAYCGIGTIGLSAAEKAREIVGIELVPEAVRDARKNAELNGIKNARFIEGDAREVLKNLASREPDFHPDVIFLDPPRSGSTPGFMRTCAKLSPERIVYVSCSPDTLRRDLRFFAELGYAAKKIQPVDMFPFSEHIEAVALLLKEGDGKVPQKHDGE